MSINEADNLCVYSGKVTSRPIFSKTSMSSSIDFLVSSRSGEQMIVSDDPEIIAWRDSIKGRARVWGRLSSRDGDSVIMAQRVEIL